MGNDGKQKYTIKYYNLDAVLSVGYRVNSRNATLFRRPGTDEIVEKFQPIDIKVDGWGGKKVQCYVAAAPGTYQLVPLFQRKGESTWFKAAGNPLLERYHDVSGHKVLS